VAAAPRDAARLRRDGPTILVYAQLSLFAFFLYAFTPSVTLLRDEEHVGDAVAGLHGTGYAAGVVVVSVVARRVLAATGRTRALWLFMATLSVGIVAYVSAPLLWLTLAGALVCGAGASGIAITVAPILLARHGAAGPAAVTEANGIAAAVGVLAPLALAGSIALGAGWRPALLLFVVLTAALYAAHRLLADRSGAGAPDAALPPAGPSVADPVVGGPPADAHPAAGPGDGGPHGPGLGRQFWLSCAIVVACVGLEFSMTLWSAELLRERDGLTPAAAATGVTAIVAGMSVGRLVGSRVARRRSVDAMLAGAFALTAAGFGVFWLSTVGWLAFAGLAVCGLGMALHYPLGIARCIRAAAGREDLASSRVSLGSGLAIGAAPFVLGLLGDAAGVRDAFLLVPALLVTASTALAAASRGARRAVTAAAAVPEPAAGVAA
jgi:predicted MFS family arabinose efflux permease